MFFGCGGSSFNRFWNIKNYQNLAEYLLENYKSLKIILIGTKAEKFISDEFKKLQNENNIDLVGKTSIVNLFSIIKNAKFIFGNDSSYIHIAYAYKTKSISIFSGFCYSGFLAYNKYSFSEENRKYLPECIVGMC